MRSCFCARRIDRRSVLLIITSDDLLSAPGEFLEEPVGIGGLEVLELRRADLRIDPLLGLAAVGGHGARVELDRVEPVVDALLDGVGGGRADAGVDLVVQLVELVLDLGLGLAADGAPEALAVAVVAERDRADVALVDLVPGDAVVTTVTASLRLRGLWRYP